jgi:hypothetical protein
MEKHLMKMEVRRPLAMDRKIDAFKDMHWIQIKRLRHSSKYIWNVPRERERDLLLLLDSARPLFTPPSSSLVAIFSGDL